ncbi:hypothetical protein RhiirA1_481955, partial [Rhizophagus irregularis]
LTTKQSQNSQEPKNVANTEIVVSEADKIAAKLSAAKSTKASLKQPRRSRQKNKKTDHQTQEVIIIEPNNTLEICDTQDQHDSIDNSDKAAFTALSNTASDTSCHEVIKARRYDKAKDVRSVMFDIFGEKNLTRINTSAGVDDIRAFKNSKKTKQAFKYLFKADDDNNLPYVEAIKKKAWGKKNTTKKDTAFTLAICEIVLTVYSRPQYPGYLAKIGGLTLYLQVKDVVCN